MIQRRLADLVHHRWNIQVISELHHQSGAKFITLLNRLEVSRGSLSASLTHLTELGYVRRNTGHGHPMRPEYLLTRHGIAIADPCSSLVQVLHRRNEVDLAFRKWTLPLVVAIGARRSRFNHLRSLLQQATPRAIAIGLKSLIEYGWAERSIFDHYPPSTAYELRPKGHQILVCANGLYPA